MFKIILLVQVISIITGLFSLKRKRPVILCIIFFITVLATLNQQLVIPYFKDVLHVPRNVCYNIFSLLDISGWFVIFGFIFQHNRFIKHLVISTAILITCYSLTELFITGTLKEFHSKSFMCFNVCMVIFSVAYISILPTAQYRHAGRDAAFWLSAAALTFNGLFLLNLLSLIDPHYSMQPQALYAFYIVQSIASIINYLFICLAFITSFYKPRLTVRQYW